MPMTAITIRLLVAATAILLLSPTLRAAEVRELARIFDGYDACFVVHDVRRNDTLRWNAERCAKRFSPCSTFKIPNTLIALETGAATDADFVQKWDGTKQPFKGWEKDHSLRTAFPASCLWYFQGLAASSGEKRMRHFVNRFDYGNRDLSGGLTNFWLQSSLKISADEQVEFLKRMLSNELPVSKRATDLLKEIMIVTGSGEEAMRGKTGTAGDPVKRIPTLGWYVGYHSRGEDAYIFAVNISGGENPSGRTAGKLVEQLLEKLGVKSKAR